MNETKGKAFDNAVLEIEALRRKIQGDWDGRKSSFCKANKEMPEKCRGFLKEIEGSVIAAERDDKAVRLKFSYLEDQVYFVKDTLYDNRQPLKTGDRLHIIAYKVPDIEEYIAVSMLRDEDAGIFRETNLFLKIKQIELFIKLGAAKRGIIKQMQETKRYKLYQNGEYRIFKGIDELKIKYQLTKENYPTEVQASIERLFEEIPKAKSKAKEKLECLLNISPICQERRKLEEKELRKALDDRLYKMDEAKQQLIDILISNDRAGIRGVNILLVGAPGVGKSSLAECVADLSNIPYEILPLNGMSSPLELEGLDSDYEGASIGRFTKAFCENGTSEMVFVMDEIDKVNITKEGNPYNCLYRILTGEHEDKFLETKISTQNTIFIATANSLDGIPEPIINRFHCVINIEGYTMEDKMAIAREYTIPALCKKFCLQPSDIVFLDDAVRAILKYYCEDSGARDMQHNMEKIIRRMIGREIYQGIVVSAQDVEEILGKKPIPRGNFPEGKALPGIVRALSVNGKRAGQSFAIETVLIPCDERKESTLHITGLPKESAVESVKIAYSYAKRYYPELMRGKEIHLHFAEGAVPKDGPSAGVAIIISLLSAVKKKAVFRRRPYDIACTGEIDLMGGVYAVGGIIEKIQAAADANCCRVYIPRQNYTQLEPAKLKGFACEIVPVSNVSEVIEQIFLNNIKEENYYGQKREL